MNIFCLTLMTLAAANCGAFYIMILWFFWKTWGIFDKFCAAVTIVGSFAFAIGCWFIDWEAVVRWFE